MSNREGLRQHALDFLSRGWTIFPVGGEDGKKPLLQWSRVRKVKENQIDVWLHTLQPTGWGVVTGEKSGLVVVDVDGDVIPDAVQQTPTYTVSTPSGGWHFYYSSNTKIPNSASKIAAKVDVRGDGGYVVGAGSARPEGRRYTYEGGAVAPLPPQIASAALERPVATEPKLAIVHSPQGDSERYEKCRKYLRKCQPAVSGQGGHNQALKVARAAVQGFALGQEDAYAVMQHWNKRCQPPWSERELRHKIEQAATTPDPSGRPHGYMLEAKSELVVLEDDLLPPELPREDPATADEEREELATLLAEQGDIARVFLRHMRGKSRIWQPGLATGAALALGATLAGRRWQWTGMTSHLYILGVGGSACGKDVPMKALSAALGERVIAGMPSVKALRDALEEQSDQGWGACLVSGEIAKLLRQILGGRAPAYLALASQLLLELGTWGAEDMRFERAAGDRQNGEQRQQVLRSPCLSIYGTATPEDLLEVLGEASLRDGLLGRFLVFRAQSILPDKKRPASTGPNRALDTILGDIDRARQNWLTVSDSFGAPHPEDIPATDGQILADYDEEIHRARQIRDSVLPDELLGRQAEHAHRVALAIAGLASDPKITAQGERLAIRLVERAASDLWGLAHNYAAGSPWERGLKRVLSAAREHARHDGYCRRRDILRQCRDRDVQAWIDALIAEGSLQVRSEKAGNGRESLVYRAV